MVQSLATRAPDLGIPDTMKIGVVSGRQRAAALGETTGMPLSWNKIGLAPCVLA
jgi:hypothetical protein